MKKVLVLNHPKQLSDRAYKQIRALLDFQLVDTNFEGAKTLILEDGMTVKVLEPEICLMKINSAIDSLHELGQHSVAKFLNSLKENGT